MKAKVDAILTGYPQARRTDHMVFYGNRRTGQKERETMLMEIQAELLEHGIQSEFGGDFKYLSF